ncbi:polar amino acid transport system substrate-binding protein [Herbaspirillum sp. Sphag1AN]|uniref:transporter substrate-binding domain-containing protein n=1 Tax=unclassified Herbaspirillum TaxID=2624150 RepID=UPI00161FCE4D|nr:MULTISPECIES: transporter substrate-binding domain-containing protein [unclassified Herbaspirillum]MBB3214795.1 polar amino acid transport system substrate-binding protein [Herbaspirillum sp. Sphag1AN]MBB3247984.1 polar amino acid transport system substrate-binding protein [Herbaspirillum sp. Sphag64]
MKDIIRTASLTRNLVALTLSALLPLAAFSQTSVPGQIKVGMEITYPPFESWQGDKVVGFDPDVADMLGRVLKVKPSFVDTKFPSLILGLTGGQFDAIISGMYITPERTAQADAIAYAQTGAAIMVAKDGGITPKTEKDLCGLKVGLQAGTSWVNALKKLSTEYCAPNGKPAVAVSEFPTAPEVSQALLSKNIQAQMEIAGAAKMLAERSKGRIVISSPALVYPQTLGIYVKKGNTALYQSLEKALAASQANGEYAALIKKYDLEPVATK